MSNKLSAVKLANIYDDANNYSLQLSDDKTFPYKAYVAGATFEATKSLEQLQAKDAEIEALKRAIGIRDEVMAKKDADLDRANNFSTKVGDAYYLRQTSLSEKDEEIGRLDAVIKSQGKLFNQLDAEVTSCRRTIAGHESAYDSVRKELLERDADIAGLKSQLVLTVKELTEAKGMHWVKAIDRMPEASLTEVFCRWVGDIMEGEMFIAKVGLDGGFANIPDEDLIHLIWLHENSKDLNILSLPDVKQEAIAFAIWVQDNDFERWGVFGGGWVLQNERGNKKIKALTNEQLYSLFKNDPNANH